MVRRLSRLPLSRQSIYFHHIINGNKRKAIQRWAKELSIGGFTKIGWPGVMILEGQTDELEIFTKRLKQQRWQYMQVRGRMSNHPSLDDDRTRWLPIPLVELPTTTTLSHLSTLCAQHDVHALYCQAIRPSTSSG